MRVAGRYAAMALGALLIMPHHAAAQQAPEEATLSAPETAAAGSTIEVSWTGPGAEADFISVDEAGAPERSYGPYVSAGKGSPSTLRVPDEPGDYEIRYHLANTYAVLGRTPLSVTDVSARIETAATAPVGGEIEIRWEGPAHERDFISIDPAGAPDRQYGPYGYATKGSPLTLRAPDEAGDYAVRYHLGSTYRVVGEAPLQVTDLEATLDAPASAAAGSQIAVTWTGPDNPRDFVSIDPAGAEDRTYGNYAYTSSGNPLSLRAPDQPGDYVVRYHLPTSYRVIGETPLQVTDVAVSLDAPASVTAGSEVAVSWQGPDNARDFISIDPVGAEERTYGNYAYTSSGNPLSLRVPDEPGGYALRYHLAQSYRVLGERPLEVASATAKVMPPAEAQARSVIEIRWEGPDNQGDFITIVAPGTPERQYGQSNGYTARGNPVRVEAPREPGQYEVRYLTGAKYLTLASAPLEVVPGTTPGRLRVVGDAAREAQSAPGAVELVLDASGSMLQRIEGQPRIEIARNALVELTQNVLEPGTPFALRVFGHREADSCRTDLEIPLAPLQPAEAVTRIRSIEAKNLARTPIGASLLAVREDLAGSEGSAVVVLVTDGEETCEGDPAAAISTLRKAGLDVRVNIVGFAIDELVLKETFEEWARIGQGSYFDARDDEELSAAMRASLRVPYQVLRDGAVIATGVVNGEPIEVEPGSYEVRVLTNPPRDAGAVTIESGEEHELGLEEGQ